MLPDEERVALECDFGRFEVEAIEVVQESLQRWTGYIRISADIMAVTVGATSPQCGLMTIQSSLHTTIGILYPDITSEIKVADSLFFLHVRNEAGRLPVRIPHDAFSEVQRGGYSTEPMCMGLALRPCHGKEKSYQRVGLVRYMRRASLDIAATQSILLY
jgi:hypothetical protein